MILPVAKLLIIEALVILRTSVSQRVVIRVIGLNQNLSGPVTTAGASRNLSDELKRSFRRTEIRQSEAGVN